MLIRACTELMTSKDHARLKEHGMGDMALTHALVSENDSPTDKAFYWIGLVTVSHFLSRTAYGTACEMVALCAFSCCS